MAIERWHPRRGLGGSRQRAAQLGGVPRLDDMFDQLTRDMPAFSFGEGESRMVAPALGVTGGKDELVVRADLPGLDQKDVQVEIQDGTLTLRGERTEER